jgi:L-aminopeptidase/D-esterase-like protein
VPAAIIFDLGMGDGRIRPDAQASYRACEAASTDRSAEGNVGAGAGATVGKLFGTRRAMKGGLGMASIKVAGLTVGALVVVNAVGDVMDPDTARPIAGARTEDGRRLLDARRAIAAGQVPERLLASTNTTPKPNTSSSSTERSRLSLIAEPQTQFLIAGIDSRSESGYGFFVRAFSATV